MYTILSLCYVLGTFNQAIFKMDALSGAYHNTLLASLKKHQKQ